MKRIILVALLAAMCGLMVKAQLPKLKDTPITAKFGGYIVGDYSYYTDEDVNKTVLTCAMPVSMSTALWPKTSSIVFRQRWPEHPV